MAKIKGMLLTLGFFIIMLIFFSFAVIITNSLKFSKDRASEYIFLDKMKTLDESAQQGFRTIFNVTSGIAVSKGTNVTIFERLPNNKATVFNSNLTKYSGFINSSYPMNLNLSITKELALWIKPHNIKYYHVSYGGSIIKVEPKDSTNFNKYSISLITDHILGVNSCSSSGNSNGLLDVFANGSTGFSCSKSSITNLSLFDTSSVLIATVGLTSNVLTITSQLPVNVTTKIIGLTNLNKTIDIKTDENALFMNFSEYNFDKSGSIRIV